MKASFIAFGAGIKKGRADTNNIATYWSETE